MIKIKRRKTPQKRGRLEAQRYEKVRGATRAFMVLCAALGLKA